MIEYLPKTNNMISFDPLLKKAWIKTVKEMNYIDKYGKEYENLIQRNWNSRKLKMKLDKQLENKQIITKKGKI